MTPAAGQRQLVQRVTSKRPLARDVPCGILSLVRHKGHHGPLAHLGERHNGIVEVRGSSPRWSTSSTSSTGSSARSGTNDGAEVGEMSDLIDYGMSGIAILTLLIAVVLISVIWSAALGSPLG